MEEKKFKVFTRCYTYNHAPYIEDALRGFAIQETTFPVVFAIIDDSSTDGEPEKLKKWAENNLEIININELWKEMPYGKLAVAPLKGKPQSLFVIVLLSENHFQKRLGSKKREYVAEWNDNSEYQALCEGDDYWTDPNKLQKQVSCLDSHEDSVLCYTGYEVVDNHKEKTNNRYRPLICYSGDVFDKLLKTNFIQTATVLVRTSVYMRALSQMVQRGAQYDYGLYLELSLLGNFQYIEDKTSAYRICEESASHSNSLIYEINFAKKLRRINTIYHDLRYKPEGRIKSLYNETRLFFIVTIKHYLRRFVHYRY